MRAHTRRLPALAAATAIAVACAACGSSPGGPGASGSNAPGATGHSAGFPVTISTAGGKLHLTTRPDAIISLSPTGTEMLYAIGAGRQVRAVDSQSDFPASAPRTKLSAYQPNAEAIAAYHPDLVLISNDMDGITAKLKALSIPVLYQPAAASLTQVYAEFEQLGEATGHAAQARAEVKHLQSDISKIVASVPPHNGSLSYFYELGTAPYYSATSTTFIGSLLALLGMKSIADSATGAAAAGGYPSLSAEFILKANPDYIILSDTGSNGGQDTATVDARPGWSVLAAVREHHIIVLNPDIASRWGPRVVQLLQTVAASIKPGSP